MNAHVNPPQTVAPNKETEWVLARARCMSAGLRLVQFQIDEIGVSLKNGWITAAQAQSDLAALEQLPCFVASVLLGQTE
jgi:hypothetical protein